MHTLDAAWLRANPLPTLDSGSDKNLRGRVLVVGGSRRVPGAPILCAAACFRSRAGKVLIGTIAEAALGLGLALPEAGVMGLSTDENGELAPTARAELEQALERTDCLLLGPGISDDNAATRLLEAMLRDLPGDFPVVLDAAAVACAGPLLDVLARSPGRFVMTPHHGEMAGLLGSEVDAIVAARRETALETARRSGAVIVLKGATTIVASDGDPPLELEYHGGAVGLATSGSGDVLAGLIAGLASSGIPLHQAAAWGVWLHGEAGRRLAESMGPIGFMARELLPPIPALMRGIY